MKFRHKLLLFGITVATLTALAVFVAGGALIRRSFRDRVTERLESEARALSEVLQHDRALLAGGAPSPAADSFADRMGRSLGLRVTLIDPGGVVVGDSSLDGEALLREDNHATRPEIVIARQAGIGSSIRVSGTVHDLLFYVASRVEDDGRLLGFVRLAIPVSEIERTTGNYSASLAGLSFLSLIVVALAGYGFARRFSRPLEEMSATADSIAQGRYDLIVEYESPDEVGRLGSALNRMTRSVSEQLDALSREKRLRDAILGGMKEGILVVDRDRRVLLCNDAFRTAFGLHGQDPTGRPLLEVVRDIGVVEGFDTALAQNEEYRSEVRVQSGGRLEVRIASLTDPAGLQIGAIGLFLDVTRLSALESVRREFVADVSHELRTPLTSIKAFVETLLAGGLEDPVNNRRFVEIIKKHSDRMEALLDDLTDLSLIETGAIALEIGPVELVPVVRELIDTLRPQAESKGVSLANEVPASLSIQADRRRLEQILLNLLDNAIKFNRPGGTVRIRASTGTTPGAVTVEVEDTGIGIPPDALEKIFHRFYRVDRARAREVGGTGLGLSIVKHLMRLNGGSIQVESEPGRGSRFELEFRAA